MQVCWRKFCKNHLRIISIFAHYPLYMKPIQFFNGRFVAAEDISFSVKDVGILRSFAIFDYFKAYGGIPVFMDDHLDRFENSAKQLGLSIPFSRREIAEAIYYIVEHNNYPLSGIKLLLTGGDSDDGFSPGKPNLAILNTAIAETPAEHYAQGVSLMTYRFTREMPEAKTIGYATALKLQPQWIEQGHVDVLYHDGEWITEVSRSNLFMICGRQLITNGDNILHGITRKKILELGGECGFNVQIRPVKLSEAMGAEELFMTSTNKKVMPVVALNQHKIAGGLIGEGTKLLMEAFNQLIDEQIIRGGSLRHGHLKAYNVK